MANLGRPDQLYQNFYFFICWGWGKALFFQLTVLVMPAVFFTLYCPFTCICRLIGSAIAGAIIYFQEETIRLCQLAYAVSATLLFLHFIRTSVKQVNFSGQWLAVSCFWCGSLSLYFELLQSFAQLISVASSFVA